jgi:fibronectin type 3 domain-containing protein
MLQNRKKQILGFPEAILFSSRLRKYLLFSLIILLGSILITSCGSTPKPEGKDFLSESNKYGREETGRGSVFVNPIAQQKLYRKVAAMPFHAPVELVGASIADMVGTEILKTYKYQLIERSQMEQVLEEQSLGLKGVTQSKLAMRVGKILGVEGVIIGTVPEYGMRAIGPLKLPAVGVNIRMIDAETGSIIWSITDSAICKEPISLSAFARHLISSMIHRLQQEWVRAGDTVAISFPSPQVTSYKGKIRKVIIELMPDSSQTFTSYRLFRSRTEMGSYTQVAVAENEGRGNIVFEDEKLLDATTYYYKVDAVSTTGLTGPPFGPFKVTTKGPPTPVFEFQTASNRIRKVPLSWTPINEPEVKGYAIYRANQRSGPYKEIAFIEGKDANQYLDKGKKSSWGDEGHLKDNTEYFYKIQSVNVVDVHSPDSPLISAVTKPIPVPVTGLKAKQREVKQVSLNWQPNPEADIKEYRIFRGDSQDSIEKNIKNVPANVFAYTDKKLKDGRRYFYKIQAIDKDNLVGKFSDTVSAMTKPLPTEPKGLLIELVNGQLKLSWHKNPEVDIAKYQVFKKASFAWEKVGETTDPTFFYRDELKAGKTIIFRVNAVDTSNLESNPSLKISYRVPK